ncbi:MAG: right-handed parallel beta-helix repeat-containing protein [bacterium]|nr:right-handed parallel beta-helix repeat-containing protein [bacterium]
MRRKGRCSVVFVVITSLGTLVLHGAEFYVATNGNDVTGDGSAAAPFRTFDKAHSVMAAGDDIFVGPGVHATNRLRITKSGTANNPIVVAPVPGARPVLDMLWRDEPCVLIYGRHVVVEGLELRNSSNMCARLHGESNVLRRCIAHHAVSHGIMTSGTNNVIEGCEVYLTVLENAARGANAGWGSGVKVFYGAKNSVIVSNVVYHNYGEGICVTRGMGAVVRQNVSYDNYSVLIYVDNSYEVVVEKNHCYSLGHSGFTREGRMAAGIALAEEQYSGWGAQLRDVRVINNVVCFADRGFIYYGSDVAGGGLSNVVVAYNTFWGSSNTAISVEYQGGKLGGSYIANNIVQQPAGAVAWVDDRYVGKAGLKLFHNFWVGMRPADWRNCNGPGDRTGSVAFVREPVVTDAYSFVIAEGSAPCGGATNIFGVREDYAGVARPAIPRTHDMGAFQAIPEGGAVLGGVLWVLVKLRRC